MSGSLTDNPELMLMMLAKLTGKAGGYLVIQYADPPTEAFNLVHRFNDKSVELRLLPYGVLAADAQEGSA